MMSGEICVTKRGAKKAVASGNPQADADATGLYTNPEILCGENSLK
jgi:hypothetical protein